MKLKVAGPLMYTLLFSSLHSMNKSPPGNVTRVPSFPALGILPARIAATTNAHVPVPLEDARFAVL